VANLKLVGAVAIKVRPDATGFRGEAQREIDRELAGVKAKVKVEIKISADATEAKEDAKLAAEEIEKNSLKLKVGLDYESIQKAQRQLNDAIKHLMDVVIKVDLNDEGSIAAAQAELEKMRNKSKIEIEFTPDEKGFRDVIAKLEQIKRDNIIKEWVTIDFDDASIDAKIAELQARLDLQRPQETITLRYNEDHAGLERLVATIDAELLKIREVKFDVKLDEPSLMKAKRHALEALDNTPVRIVYDDNLAGLLALKAKLHAFLPKLSIVTDLDEASVLAKLAWVDEQIKAHEPEKIKIKPEISSASYFKVFAALKALTRNMTVGIFVKLNNISLLLAAAKLTGLRAASRWTEEFARTLGSLDRNLPIVAAAVIGLSTLASGVVTLTADMFSLGNGIGQVLRMGALMAPTLLLGLGSVMIVLQSVFKDFGAAAHGIQAAMKRLPPAGQEAARIFQKVFGDIRQSLSEAFWDRASDAMLRFSKIALPAFGAGLTKLSGSLGGIFGNILDSFNRLTQQGGLKLFFDNMSHGFDVAQTGLADFMDAFNTLAVLGSTAFPRIGRAFNEFAAKFDSWVNRLAADGTLSRWIDLGVQGLKDLFNAGVSLTKVWGNIGMAAQAAGALTLTSFARMLDKMDTITSGNRFQTNMKLIFQGAREASTSFHKALGSLGPAMDVFSVTVKNTLSGAGAALGAFIRDVGDIMASPKVGVGMTAFLSGVKSMFESLRPAAESVATILQTFGQVLGKVATDSGPLFRNLFEQLANVLVTAWAALEPFLPALIQIGTTVINILGPALAAVTREGIPAFANGLQKIGEGLLPLVRFLGDFAVNLTKFLSGLQIPTIALMAGVILSLGPAFTVAAAVVPVATAAMEAFGIMAGITAIKTQLLVPVIGILLAALSGLMIGGIAAFASSQQSATPFAQEYADALDRDAEAAHGLAGAIGEATTATALHKLVTSGAFEAAERLGIGRQTIMDAVLKGGPALEETMSVIKGAKKVYTDARDGALLYAMSGQEVDIANQGMSESTQQNTKDAELLEKQLNENRGSLELGIKQRKIYAEVSKTVHAVTGKEVETQKALAKQMEATSQTIGTAASASQVLQDAFSSSASKVDAMRKSLAILVPPNTKQQVAESLGAYAKGLADIRETAKTLKPEIEKLGNSAFGEKGFLNVASGNKAVMQLNQALVDEVNNVWAGAKVAYDTAIAAGKTSKVAFAEAQQFVKDHKGDYDQLATGSGVAVDKIQGQWEALFGKDGSKEWVMKIILEGAVEAAARAEQMVTLLGGKWDGKDFQATMDADPTLALLAIKDPVAAAEYYVNKKWKATIEALPDKAVTTITKLTNQTRAQWNEGDFSATLQVADGVPGLQEALTDIRNGVGVPYYASIFASLNRASELAVRIALNMLTMPRTVAINVAYSASDTPDSFVPRGGQRLFRANGGVFDGANREIQRFGSGGFSENHVAQISRVNGPLRIWGERETLGEAYIPLSSAKRPRSVAILGEVARRFGYELSKGTQYVGGGIAGGTTSHTSADVHIGSIHTVDMNEAVAALRQSQRDALAVAGISSIGV
jgi:hypothetical protein